MDSITSLPPPPPSPSRLNEEIESDSEPLPPPPPEMFRSNLSLDSLPPPPAPGELPICNAADLSGSNLSLASLPPPPSPLIGETGTIRRAKPKQSPSIPTNCHSPERTPTHHGNQRALHVTNNMQIYASIINNGLNGSHDSSSLHNLYSGSNASTPICAPPSSPSFLLSQPPPFVPPPAYGMKPPEPVYVVQLQHQPENQQQVQQQIQPQSNGPSVNKSNSNMDTIRRSALKQSTSHYASPPYLAELKAASSPQPQRRVTIQEPPASPKVPKTGTGKKISFNLLPQQEPGSPALPLRKPLPPRRSDSTRLTSPKKLAVSDQAPPGDFLKDLQRVMRKKWQVAQKCKLDSTTTPHEVLGFRDPPPAIADYRETNVSNWVQEHYGTDNLYENVYAAETGVPVEYISGNCSNASSTHQDSLRFAEDSGRNIIATAIAGKKRPPPPPPKRAETTQLTTRQMH
jgi:hypothetical protein